MVCAWWQLCLWLALLPRARAQRLYGQHVSLDALMAPTYAGERCQFYDVRRLSFQAVQQVAAGKPWLDEDWRTKPEALTNPRFLDAHLGQGEKLLAYTLFHVDGLLRIANDAVEVSM